MALPLVRMALPSYDRPSICFPTLSNFENLTCPGDGLRSSINRFPALGEIPAMFLDYLPVPSNPPTVQDWQSYRQLFTRLYRDENRPWHEVQLIMEKDYGFKARYGILQISWLPIKEKV